MRQLTLNFQNDTEPSGGMRTLSLPEGSRSCASRSASPVIEKAREMPAISGRRCLELFGRFVPDGSWAKTFPELLIGRRDWFSSRCVLTWKMRATKSNRLYFQLVVSMPHTKGIEYGLLPTAQTQGLKICVKGKTVFMPLGFMPTPTALDCGSGRMNRSLSKGASERPTLALAARMGMLPTPTANDARNVSLPPSQAKRDGGMVKTAMQSDEYRAGAGFRLNPRFVAEMMGFPVDWTALPFQGGAGNPSKPTATP